MSYIGADEFVFNNDPENGIHSGGFSVNSIFMRAGMSPIMTLNSETTQNGGSDKVSDIFNDLVVPNWAFSYNPNLTGGNFNGGNFNGGNFNGENFNGGNFNGGATKHEKYESDDDTIDEDLHDKLLDLVKHHDTTTKAKKNKATKKNKNIKPTPKRKTKRNQK